VTTNPGPADPTDTPDPDRPAGRPLRYRGRRLDGPIQHFHTAVDALNHDTVPYSYYAKVLAGRDDRAAIER
jgi:hypothetical protein